MSANFISGLATCHGIMKFSGFLWLFAIMSLTTLVAYTQEWFRGSLLLFVFVGFYTFVYYCCASVAQSFKQPLASIPQEAGVLLGAQGTTAQSM